ncbi:MAG: uL15 family ribosomal protein [Candidatus Pacearchaeota archaeon]
MKIKKRDKRSRIRGRRTIGKGSRKKRRGKGSRGGKGMAGTGKRAGQKLTLIQKYYKGEYLGKRGFTSHKKLKKKREKFITVSEIISKFYMSKENKIDLSNFKILAGNNIYGIEFLKGKEIICKDITDNAKKILEENGIIVNLINEDVEKNNS